MSRPGGRIERIASVFSSRSKSPSLPSPEISNSPNLLYDSNDSDSDSEPPLTPLELYGYKERTKRRLLSNEVAEDLRSNVPSLLQISHKWSLLYSMEQDGTSLNTLYSKAAPTRDRNILKRRGYFLVLMDSNHDIFGAYLNDYLRPQEARRYYGNGDCFLWKCEVAKIKHIDKSEDKLHRTTTLTQYDDDQDQIRLKIFPYTSLNDFIIYSDHNFISIGSGGGKFGLWIGSDLVQGASDFVETFGNEPLSKSNRFNILALELWKID